MTQDPNSPDHLDEDRREPVLPVAEAERPARRSWFRRSRSAPAPEPAAGTRGVPRSKRGNGTFITGFNAALTILTLAMLTAAIVVHYGIHEFERPGPLQAATPIVVPKGAGLREVAETLTNAKAIGNQTVFMTGVQFSGNRGKLQAGEYEIPARASMSQIMAMIASGQVVEHSITIPEGLTSLQIVNRLMEEPLLTGQIRQVPPEGTLLPETYQIVRGTTREQMVARMAQAQKKLLDEVWAARDPNIPVKTPQELVTLASIVEKETGIASERPHVASVFSNRLIKRMRIQSDPTIIYGLVGGKGTLGRPILRSEILRPTPYNTYTIPALPPGPIANPGRASMEATAKPLQTADLYFVADGTGGHAFAATYAEHQKNVARWREADKAAGETDRAPVEALSADPAAAIPATPPVAPKPAKPAPRRATP